MPRRHVIHCTAADKAMQAVVAMRKAAVLVCAQAPIDGVAYRAARDLLTALDGMAEALMGKRDALRDPRPVAGGVQHPNAATAEAAGSRAVGEVSLSAAKQARRSATSMPRSEASTAPPPQAMASAHHQRKGRRA